MDKEKLKEARKCLEEGGTKKRACQILEIAYNPKRLDKLIREFTQKEEASKKIRAKKRRQAVTKEEVAMWVQSYLNGESLDAMSDQYHRSAAVIKHHLEKHGAMLKQKKVDRLNPQALPDQCVQEEFDPGELVWSAAYNCVAEVVKEFQGVYRIQVMANGIQEFSYQPAYELGSLRHLKELGVNLNSFKDYMPGEEVKVTLYETIQKANKKST